MKKTSTLLFGMALGALMLVSQIIKADDCVFIPDLFPGQEADRTETVVSAIVKVGEWGPQNGYLSNHLINPLASTNTDVVATSSNNGYNAKVFFVGVGTADVNYTETIQRSSCTGVEQTIHYTVNKGTPVAYFSGPDGSPITEYTAAYSTGGGSGEDTGGTSTGGGTSSSSGGGEGEITTGSGTYVWTPSYTMRIKQLNNDGRGTLSLVDVAVPVSEITFNSTNTDVASINASGQTTVNGLGSTVISASWPGNDNWEAVDIQYTLNVKKEANLIFNPSSVADTLGKVVKLNVVCPEGVTINRWSSTNANIASVDDEGNVTMKLPGAVYIYAYFDGNEEYAPTQCACMVTVSKRQPNITFTPQVIRLEKNVGSFTPPVMNKPADLTETYSSTYQWVASNTSVASVDAQTGTISLNGATGTATITYVFKGDVRYLAENARYYIEVTTSGITVMGTYVTSANNGDVFGDGSVVYTFDEVSGNKYIELNKDVFDAGGNVFIQSDVFLSILVKQNCLIKNTPTAFAVNSACFIWCQNRKDTITIEANGVAIQAQAIKVHDCYLFATGNNYGIHVDNEFTVSAGGYVFAQATNATKPEAISARYFIKGEGGIGGIQIMTKGVSFVEFDGKNNYGFFKGADKAPFVEIGKVPLPIGADTVTNISFAEDEDNPYDNLKVVFAESKEDKFNEADKQIEMKSKITDKQVEKALEDYEPCSSDWKKELPGTLVFDVPAGQGKVEIECKTEDGYELQVMVEGKEAETREQPNDEGSISVNYSTDEQKHVIVYMREKDSAKPAPKHAAASKKDAAPGATIKAIKISPMNVPTGVEEIGQETKDKSRKLIKDGRILILRDGKTYTITGQEING